ncbi:MaoC family dehydratase [Bacillus massiliglaciei]|uniref:MaoC family dehydratase n=1 Tax=Bacillus massiliglaciei TaxID=1816693 RepID=UPI000DA629B0|nr:MaoC family dehydratase [Bacillus massiliglaciei]
MKTKEYEIIFTQEDVLQFIQLIGDQNSIYLSAEGAKDYGFETIPLPPTMPMMAYKWFETPWELQQPSIHRKQKCTLHQIMYINEIYRAVVEVTNSFQRQKLTFIKQTLYLYNNDGQLCFEGVSDLILGGLR